MKTRTNISRRNYIGTIGVTATGLTIVPGNVLGKAFGHISPSDS